MIFNRRIASAEPEPPIRAELFSLERLQQHARSLAEAQRVAPEPSKGRPLAPRLRDNAKLLTTSYRTIVRAVQEGRSITPAAEWLLDNFHVVDEQIREIEKDLPPGYYRRLPKLAEGHLQGYPRVFGVAWAVVAHTDSAFDIQKLMRFVEAYQEVQPLTIGELWALAITLRIVLVENLRRLAESIVARIAAGQLADSIADRALGAGGSRPEPGPQVVQSLERVPWSPAFAVQLAMRLRGRDPSTTPALRWLDDKFSAAKLAAGEVMRAEMQRQSGMNVTVRNIIVSMRTVSMIDWAEFFESVSPVDAILRDRTEFQDYDFSTRDRYRRAIEQLARASGHEETEIASRLVDMAIGATNPRAKDPGYYLIAEGLGGFEKELGCRLQFGQWLYRLNSKAGILSYIGMIAALTAVLLAIGLVAVFYAGLGWPMLLAFAITVLIPASDVAVAIVNRFITKHVGAVLLPGLALREGVPENLRTVVVVPTVLTGAESIERQIQRLEVHRLSNPDDNVIFALLSDWRDSETERDSGDDRLLAIAASGIAKLNERYGPAKNGGRRFLLLHRRRLWNEGEGKWMGWERKRGKLHELNRLLRGATDTTFLPIDGQAPELPRDIEYVITLDADTRLPIGAAKRLVGKMAHPLNRPVFDSHRGLVVRGYGILQPRVTPSLPIGSQGSLFQRAFSGPNGIDQYALAVSDVYQDLFAEGSYCGKGIYEVDAFERALEGRIPENAVLSHDLLEGIFARAGLASDIEVVEEFPSRYDVSAARQHRWARGDWQLLPWIFGGRRASSSRRISIPLMGRWKLLDNLRRSLSAPATLLSLLFAWSQRPLPAGIWTAFIVLAIATPPFLPAIADIFSLRRGLAIHSRLRILHGSFVRGILQTAFLIVFLAHQAWMMVDAVTRTLYRVFFRRRHLLEWVTAAQAGEELPVDRRGLAAQIGASAAFAVVAGVALWRLGNPTWEIATPFAIVWLLSPVVARWASHPPAAGGHLSIEPSNARALRLIARRTWRYFERFATAEDNWLPPDNFQEIPKPAVAHRVSPTNVGLYLLSIVAARDFGWLGLLDALNRLDAVFETLEKMKRYRGHFYNWYDTRDLQPLDPQYISSVDSGNLAGHLVALSNACREIAKAPVFEADWTNGLEDSLALVRESALPGPEDKRAPSLAFAKLDDAINAFDAVLKRASTTPAGVLHTLDLLAERTGPLIERAKALAAERNDGATSDLAHWAEALRASVASRRRDFETLLPRAPAFANKVSLRTDARALSNAVPAIGGLPGRFEALARAPSAEPPPNDAPESSPLRIQEVDKTAAEAKSVHGQLIAIAEKATSIAMAMEFGFLFDPERQLLSIGYRCAEGTLDSNFYDLLASEARLASFFGIAKGDLPAKHWFRLGRTLIPIGRSAGLISWSGSMFEYLMPSLVMRAPAGSLLERTNRLVVLRQESYGNELDVPWGMSESEYNARDIEHTYQYSSFGVPDLGYKRGLSDSTVSAPYASGLASMIDPGATVANYRRMGAIGAQGTYGWYEAIDYTRARVPEGAKCVIVRAYMAHHQAMTIVAIANALHEGRMRARFHAEPIVQSAELLLQERMPTDVTMARLAPERAAAATKIASPAPAAERRYASAHSRIPRTHLLSNGRYSAMITAAGSGCSRWRDVAISRWREDATCDNWGCYFFLRDPRSGATWSAGYQPTAVEPDAYGAVFCEDRVEIVREDGSLATALEIAISPEDDAEVRRVSITNRGNRTREIDVTSYVELALAAQADDLAHPAFAKLFVETEFVPNLGAILAHRRQRSPSDPKVWAAHLAVVEGEAAGDIQFETDRARFLGRGQTVRSPNAIYDGWPLSNTVGAVLDPIFSLRRRVRIRRGVTARISFWTVVADSRDAVIDLADKHNGEGAFDRIATLTWTQAQVELGHLGIGADEAHLFQRLANHVLYSDPSLRPSSEVIKSGLRKASTLWPHGISGDLPIVLVCIAEDDDLELVRQLLLAHEYWRLKQLHVDLVILNERAASYAQDLQQAVERSIRMNRSMPHEFGASKSAVFALRASLVSGKARDLLMACARVVLRGGGGSLAEQVDRVREAGPVVAPPIRRPPLRAAKAGPPRPQAEFFNGFGGFTDGGREYVTVLADAGRTPAPWVNIVANPSFGFEVSTEGSGFTWSINSQQNQITPWSNDPVGDAPSEAIYVRDEETGDLWCPTALPIRERNAPYLARHGCGYSTFEHTSHGIALELTQFVPSEDSIKISRLKIANRSGRRRSLSIAAYVEWALGQSRAVSAPFIVTEMDSVTGALFAQNPWNEQFGARVAFADLKGRQTSWTGDRAEFLGRDGALDRPLAFAIGATLSGRTGAALDPCGALQTSVVLSAGDTDEIVFFVGQGENRGQAQALIEKYRRADLNVTLGEVARQWDETLGTVQVKTPDRAMDILLNRWLLYQALACRVWARTGFYQASGAYGFRDQLQDVMALCVARPEIARGHILRAAGRQFLEGDVQHWWLPESGSGIRTRVSDDRGWLAYAVAHYVRVTGESAVLDEAIPFLEGPVLRDGETDSFFLPKISEKHASLFDHCALALDKSLKMGAHGLPLMGTGDWNDGMNAVGARGKGESVWLGWFLCAAVEGFVTLAERRGESEQAQQWREQVAELKRSLEREAWDGDWYRRAFFDDGSPLGSVSNSECRIDSIAQSWSAISRAAEPARTARAMAAVDKYLVNRDDKLVLLFTPPLDNPAEDPGYIKGYPRGVRENGGQYTHGALWSAMACAMQGDGDKAAELLSILNPIRHADSEAAVHRYKVEPYVSCADVYSVPPHVGRGGWTWYTGSAGWMYRVALEWLLGFRMHGENLTLDPCIPKGWQNFEIAFRYRSARYEISVENPLGVCRGVLATKLDGEMLTGSKKLLIPLRDDGAVHKVQVVLG